MICLDGLVVDWWLVGLVMGRRCWSVLVGSKIEFNTLIHLLKIIHTNAFVYVLFF